jgi:hypothetical protein
VTNGQSLFDRNQCQSFMAGITGNQTSRERLGPMSKDDLVAAFLAKGGTVKRVDAGERTIDEKVFQRNRGDRLVSALKRPTEQDLIDEIHYVVGANGVEHAHNGLGEWIY